MFFNNGKRRFHVLILTFFLGLFIGLQASFMLRAGESPHRFLDHFHRVYQLVSNHYVEDPEAKTLFHGAIKGMMRSLDDPYSRFLDEEDYEELKEMTTGKFVGVGIEITIRDGEVVVISPIEDSPAMKAGIHSGDIIYRVNDTSLKDKKLSEIVKLIKGLAGTKVTLYVKREGHEDPIKFEVERAPIKISSLDSEIIEFDGKKIGYIKIKNFGNDTAKDTEKILRKYRREEIDNLILDFRYNPGGLLSAAVELSNLFLKKGEVIVSTRGRDGANERIFKSDELPVYSGELVVLVNKGSASASEIFAGAIRDNKRGLLLGEKTFGKGSVQKTFNLDKDLGVAITIARYYTPSGEMIHQKGIKPEVEVKQQILSKKDRKALKTIQEKNLLESFVTDDLEYNEKTRKGFMEMLRANNVTISEQAAHYILKNRINRYERKPLYDLEFDRQLKEAVERF
jgi:carboxyl-terminal processing protease